MCFEIPVCLFYNYLITQEKKKKKTDLWYITISKNPAIALSFSLSRDFLTSEQSTQSSLYNLWDFKNVMNPIVAKVWLHHFNTSFRLEMPFTMIFTQFMRGDGCPESEKVYSRILAKLLPQNISCPYTFQRQSRLQITDEPDLPCYISW